MLGLWTYLLIAICQVYGLEDYDSSTAATAVSYLSTTSTENNTDNGTVESGPGYRPSSANITCMECDDLSHWNETVLFIRLCDKPEAENLNITSEEKLHYDIGEVVSVSCKTGYRPSSSNIVCESHNGTLQWNVTVQCIGQCEKPSANNLSIISHGKEFYDIGDLVTVRCVAGYHPPSTNMTCVDRNGFPQWNEAVQCIAQCKMPKITNVNKSMDYKDYYNVNDSVEVKCEQGYWPSLKKMTCRDGSKWNQVVQCIELCKKPEAVNLNITSEEKLHYDIGEVVSVSCKTGYRPSSSIIVCESHNGTPQWNVTVQCLGQCEKPSANNLSIISHEKEFYDIGDLVTVRCDAGYHPPSTNMTCVDRNGVPQWNEAVQCIAQCKKPEITNVANSTKYKNYYNVNKSVEVTCNEGFWPSYEKMTCVKSGEKSKWEPASECIALCKKPQITNGDTSIEYKDYYNVSESVEVKCKEGHRPSHEKMTCVTSGDESKWDPASECIAQCKKPEIRYEDPKTEHKVYYNVSETVMVKCKKGYGPSPLKMKCVRRGDGSKWDQTSQCIAQCKKPEITNVANSTKYKNYYNVNKSVEVMCNEGFWPSYEKMTCVTSGDGSKWYPASECIAQCKKPNITNMDTLTEGKEYYNVSESVEVKCKEGHWPSHEKMTCVTSGEKSKWDPASECIGITMTNWKVTSASISFHILCTPKCPQHWSFSTCCAPMLGNYTSCSNLDKKTNVTFTNLQPFSEYGINTTLYINNRSFPLHIGRIRTNESVPDNPKIRKNPTVENNTIRWELSDIRGDVTGFQMNISARREYNVSFIMDESKWFLRNITEYKIPLHHGTSYTITLRGFTSAGAGNVTTLPFETEIGDPPCHMEKTMNHSTVQLLPVQDLYGPISFYEIIVFGGQEHNMSANCLRFKTVHYNSSWTSSHYTAAVLPAQNLTGARTFILGDNQYYNGFHNAPLIPKHTYTIYIRVTSQWKQVNKSSCAYAGFLEVAEPSDSTVQMIAGSISAVILLLILLILVVVWRVRSSSKVMRSSDIQLKTQPRPGKKKDIPVDKFLDVVKRFRMMEIVDTNDNEEENCAILAVGRYQEYQELPGGLIYLCSVAMSRENQTKNRYKKVLPYDDSRVVLRSSHSRSDYINASYIDSYTTPKFYIATQGPIPETVSDFWSMVWQEKSSVIVMLTGLEEQNKVKCEQYWPEQSQTYGDITVSVQKIVQTGAFTIRSFSLRKVQSIAQVMVEQIHYLRWPDHGVPKNTSDMVQLVELMNKCNPPGSGPVIVHCSAGIGRTGTFLALDILLKRARAVKKVNVYNCVLELRKRRVKMVQEKEQYIFLYNVLLETLLCGSTSVPVAKIQEHIHCTSVENRATGMTEFDKEFQALEKITELYQIYPCKEGRKLENQIKNRNPDILPGDHWRPILLSALTRHGAPGYINAVFVNTNSQDDAMIVTQLPMKHTLADFWALVWDYKCTAVVMMQRAQDLQKNDARFWPENGETCYGAFKVRTMAKNQGHGYTALTLNLGRSKGRSDSSLEVKLFQLDSWPLNRALPENPAVLISLVGEAEKCQQQTSDSHILVTCCDGAGRSGLFCAGVIMCDQIRSDGCLDVSQAVRSLRRRRCQFIPNVEQYSFCYTLAQSYLDSFETYGNFK